MGHRIRRRRFVSVPLVAVTLGMALVFGMAAFAKAVQLRATGGEDSDSGRAESATTACQPTSGSTTVDGRTSTWLSYACGLDADPKGVVVHLHGDGAGEFRNPSGTLADLAAAANSRDLLFIAPRTPDERNGVTWWHDLGGNLTWLRGLLDDPAATDGADASHLVWSGYSGGAEMISYGVLARAPELVTGGALMMGGGGVPRDVTGFASGVTSPDGDAASVPVTWAVGAEDDGTTSADGFDAVDASRRGEQFYRDLGYLNTTRTVLEGRGHYDLPQGQLLDELLDVA